MSTDLRSKLRRLGVHKGAARIQPKRKSRSRSHGHEIESLVDGRLVDTPYGVTFICVQEYEVDHVHGGYALGKWLDCSPLVVAEIGDDQAFEEIEPGRIAFVDTETTGLAGGTGTLAFVVGVGIFEQGSGFRVHQFFLRDPSEELAMLHALSELLETCDAVATFNGRSFDMPLLKSRFTLARMRVAILSAPNLDLLIPARRMWRGRLPSCALSSLEQNILGLRRKQDDVPGFLIPEMYFDYIRSGDAREMPRVLYHNEIDILSMVSLATCITRLFDRNGHEHERNAGDLFALGKWYDRIGKSSDAESALRACLTAQADEDTRAAALHRLGHLLKRTERRMDAVRIWESLSESRTHQGVEACVELAKYYEWHDVNIERAVVWTREGIQIVRDLPRGYLRERFDGELAHRLHRLGRKRKVT